jgi:hypothetical protein
MTAPEDASRANVDRARGGGRVGGAPGARGQGTRFLAEPYEPRWGGCRFFCVDPDGYLVEVEQPA